jgi:hypothetical protein
MKKGIKKGEEIGMTAKDLKGEVEYLIERWLGPHREKDVSEEEGVKFFIEDTKELIEKYEEGK